MHLVACLTKNYVHCYQSYLFVNLDYCIISVSILLELKKHAQKSCDVIFQTALLMTNLQIFDIFSLLKDKIRVNCTLLHIIHITYRREVCFKAFWILEVMLCGR